MSRPYPPQLTVVQAWLMGYLSVAQLHDLAAEMGEAGAAVLGDYGRALADQSFAEEQIAQAQRALESAELAPEDPAYEMYKALIDPHDEAVLDSQEAEGQPVGHEREQRRQELIDLRPLLGIGGPQPAGSEVAEGTVRVRLAHGQDALPFAQFVLSEADLAARIHPVQHGTRAGTIAYQAAEMAWWITELGAHGVDAARVGFQEPYISQVEAFGDTRQPALGVGEVVEVTRSTGARSVWRCSNVGWELLERQSVNAAARQHEADREQEAER